MAAQVDHPGIVQVFDADFESDNSLCFIAMELLEGRTLRAAMEDPSVGPPRLLELLTQALQPLCAAHAKGFIDRDLKPENIFVLDPPRENTTIKLLDFGIAAQEGVDRMTRTGIAMGTPHYMSLSKPSTLAVPAHPATSGRWASCSTRRSADRSRSSVRVCTR